MREVDVLACFVHKYVQETRSTNPSIELLRDKDWVDIASSLYNATQIIRSPYEAKREYEELLANEFHCNETELRMWASNTIKSLGSIFNCRLKYDKVTEEKEVCKRERSEHQEQETNVFNDAVGMLQTAHEVPKTDATHWNSKMCDKMEHLHTSQIHIKKFSFPVNHVTTICCNESERCLVSNKAITSDKMNRINTSVDQIICTQGKNDVQQIQMTDEQIENKKGSVDVMNGISNLHKEVERNVDKQNDTIYNNCSDECQAYTNSASSIDEWIQHLSTSQRRFVQELRYDTILDGDILVGLLQQCFCVVGADVFFHPVPPNTTMEYNGIRLGSYQSVIYRPMSLMVIKKVIADSKRECYHLTHYYRHNCKDNNNNDNCSNNSSNNIHVAPHHNTTNKQNITYKEEVAHSHVKLELPSSNNERSSITPPPPPSSSSSPLGGQRFNGSIIESCEENIKETCLPSVIKMEMSNVNVECMNTDQYTHKNSKTSKCVKFEIDNDTSLDKEQLCNKTQLLQKVKTHEYELNSTYKTANTTNNALHTSRYEKGELMQTANNEDHKNYNINSNADTHNYISRRNIDSNNNEINTLAVLLHQCSHPLRIATLAELERSLWLIAANCVTFNAPETYYPQTARRFVAACMHVLLNYCKRQVAINYHMEMLRSRERKK